MKFFASILTLSLFSVVQAGNFEGLDFLEGLAGDFELPSASEIKTTKDCSEEVRSVASCNVAPWTGVFVCREFFSMGGLYVSEHTVCERNVAPGITLGLESDTCGCCGGECPKPCPCTCGDPDEEGFYGSQMVKPVIFGDITGSGICVTNGAASHLTAWGGRMICDEDCLAVSETAAPTT